MHNFLHIFILSYLYFCHIYVCVKSYNCTEVITGTNQSTSPTVTKYGDF